MGGIIEWFIEDVLGIDIPDQQNPYARGQDVTIYSTESYLPEIKGAIKDLQPTVLAFAGTSDDNTGDDTENDLIHKIFIYSKAVKSIDAVRIDGVDSESRDWQDGEGNRWLHVRKFPNGMRGYNDNRLNAAGFKPDYRYTNCCCVYVRAEAGSEVVTSEPSDVRIDVTGNTPSSNLDSASAPTQKRQNNVEQFYQWLTRDKSGANWPTSMLDLTTWRKSAKDCNIQIETYPGSGVYQARYTFNQALDTSLKTHEIIKLFRESIRAYMPFDHRTGKYQLILEQDDNYASQEITATDIIGGIRTNENADVGKKVNQVIVKFPDAEQKGKTNEAIYPPPGSSQDLEWLSQDNQQRKSKTIEQNACNDYYQAMQQAKIEAEHSREGLTAVFRVRPELYRLQVAKVVNVTVSERGWNKKPFRILSKTLNDNLVSELRLREHQPYIFDYHNTGQKPKIPDTTLDPRKLQAPVNLTITDSAYGGKKAIWTSAYSKFDWQLENQRGAVIQSGQALTRSLELTGLKKDHNYVLALRSRNNIGQVSDWIEQAFLYDAEEEPQSLPANPNTPVILIPDAENPDPNSEYVWKVYYALVDYGDNPNIEQASYGGLVPYGSGQMFTINNAFPLVTYFVWFGLIKKEQAAETPFNWVKKTVFSGSGMSLDHLDEQIRVIVENPFEQLQDSYQQAIKRATGGGELDLNLENTRNTIQTQVNDSMFESLNAVLDASNRDRINADHINEINGWRMHVNEQIGKLIVEGGQVNYDQWIAYRLTVDTQKGILESLSQRTQQVENTTQQHITVIEQLTDQIAFIVENVELNDIAQQFNQLYQRFDSAENSIEQQSLAIAIRDLEILDQLLDTQLNKSELVGKNIELALARQTMSSLTDENSAQAELIQQVTTVANQGFATARQAIKALSDESIQRIENDTQLNASQQTANALIISNSQAIASETEARSRQLSQLASQFDNQNQQVNALVSRIEEVETDSEGNAAAIAEVIANVEDEETGLAAAFITLNAQQDELNGIKATATIGVTSDGAFTGVYVEGSKVSSSVTISGGQFRFWDNQRQLYAFDYSSAVGWLFRGKVYAENLEGDVVDIKVKPCTNQSWELTTGEKQILSFTVTPAPFDRNVSVSSVNVSMFKSGLMFLILKRGDEVIDTKITRSHNDNGSMLTMPPLFATIPANQQQVFSVYLHPDGVTRANIHDQTAEIKVYKEGSSIL